MCPYKSKVDDFHSKVVDFHSKVDAFHSKVDDFQPKLDKQIPVFSSLTQTTVYVGSGITSLYIILLK